jgi:ATP-dependent DNA helicase PIF1
MQQCSRCKERWFDIKLMADGVCKRCHDKDDKKRQDEPFLYSAANHLDFGSVPPELPQLEPLEELFIARVHVSVNVFTVRGQQYNYRGHVVHFLRDVGKVYSELPLLPKDLDIVILRPRGSEGVEQMDRQFRNRFRVRRAAVEVWLRFLADNHPGYRNFTWNYDNLSQLPEDGDVFDQLNIHEVEECEGLPADSGPVEEPEEDREVVDEAAVPNMLIHDSELNQLQGRVNDGATEVNEASAPRVSRPPGCSPAADAFHPAHSSR